MASKVTKVITVSIGSEQIKLSEVIKNKKDVSVVWVASVPTPPNSYDDGEIVDIERISRTLKQVIYHYRVFAKSIIFTVQGPKIANKEIVIPYIKKDKIKAMVDANRSDYFPINTEEYVFSHSVLEQFTEEGKKKIRLMVIAAPEALIDSYYTLAERLELKLETIDYIGNSSLQMIKHQVDTKPNIIIQINDNNTAVNIVKNGVLQLQRNVPYGRNVLINAVMDEYQVDENKALYMLKSQQLVHKSFDGDQITDSMRYMAGNLSRIVDYYTTRNQENLLDKAYIITNGEEIKGLSELFATELNLTTVMLNELKNVTAHKLFNMPDNHLMDYMENLGAVLDPVNIRSKKVVETSRKKESKNNGVALIIGAVVISAVLVGYPFWTYLQVQEERDDLQKKIDGIKEVEEIVNNYYNAKDRASDMLQFVTSTYSDNDSILYMFEKLEEVMPSDISISSFSVTEGLISISATGSSKMCVAKFLEELGKLENVYDIQIAGMSESRDEEDNIMETFSLTFRFLMVAEEETETGTDVSSAKTTETAKEEQ